MRQFTIAERLFAATLLPLTGMMPYLSTVFGPLLDDGNAAYAQIFITLVIAAVAIAVVLATAYSVARPLVVTADTIDAMAHGELGLYPCVPPNRSEIAQLIAVTERLAEVIGERQRRELVHDDLDRAWQASRRANLSNLAREVETATEGGIQPIVDSATALQFKARDMLDALEAVRAVFDETARAAESSRALNHAAGQLSDEVM